jgi:hypothetical protein
LCQIIHTPGRVVEPRSCGWGPRQGVRLCAEQIFPEESAEAENSGETEKYREDSHFNQSIVQMLQFDKLSPPMACRARSPIEETCRADGQGPLCYVEGGAIVVKSPPAVSFGKITLLPQLYAPDRDCAGFLVVKCACQPRGGPTAPPRWQS